MLSLKDIYQDILPLEKTVTYEKTSFLMFCVLFRQSRECLNDIIVHHIFSCRKYDDLQCLTKLRKSLFRDIKRPERKFK